MNSFSLPVSRNSMPREVSPMSRSAARLAVMQMRGGAPRQEREMFTAVCDSCGGEARVPFQPREGRPIYCSACYAKMKEEA